MTGKELLSIAVKVESTGYSYYSKLAEKASGNLKTLFQELANQERDHAKRFEEIMKKYENDSNFATWQNEEVSGYAETYAKAFIFPEIENEQMPETLVAAIRKAIEVEKDSIIYYNELRLIVPDPKPVEEIIKEEKEHLRKLSEKLTGEDISMFSEGSMI
ncbi:ferritin-like domain-containing protein [Fervidobacterium nodosum]|uniref:Rubrerythrin n=1 Tax=Fervidobacterium nodosum (strain ATCC 35602 / DSM 5306 / Rt17-B1) TaxID=381764 RepID=A7HJ23_FERNB|nr:ferritin family protein [Fervidobacterium nodosum]ABS59906.1 Rubrerythrin [Fervidobacterium nodosum Rt17-B1]HOJ94955.1 ferritin family protein [Fervidobacterium nodosum]